MVFKWHVPVHQVAESCEKLGAREVQVRSVDLTSGASIDGLCEELIGLVGHIDVLVNNAGIASWEGQGPIEGALLLPRSFVGPWRRFYVASV